jgi:hypothetical protein
MHLFHQSQTCEEKYRDSFPILAMVLSIVPDSVCSLSFPSLSVEQPPPNKAGYNKAENNCQTCNLIEMAFLTM